MLTAVLDCFLCWAKIPALCAKFLTKISEWFGCVPKTFLSSELEQCTTLKNETDKTSHYFQPAHSTFPLNANSYLGCIASTEMEVFGTTVFKIIKVNTSDTSDRHSVLITTSVKFFGSWRRTFYIQWLHIENQREQRELQPARLQQISTCL